MKSSAKVVLVALAAGVLGLAASLLTSGPGPLLRSELGQRALNAAMRAGAPPAPAGVAVAARGHRLPSFSLHDLDGHPMAVPASWAGRMKGIFAP